MKSDLVVFVDVDDTLVRSIGTKRIPMPRVIERVRQLHARGARLYCWSTGGREYARETARELHIEECFLAYLPKPQLVIDDQRILEWRGLRELSPLECSSRDIDDLLG